MDKNKSDKIIDILKNLISNEMNLEARRSAMNNLAEVGMPFSEESIRKNYYLDFPSSSAVNNLIEIMRTYEDKHLINIDILLIMRFVDFVFIESRSTSGKIFICMVEG